MMSAVKVYYSKQASATDAFALLAEGYNELVQDGHTPDRLGASPVSWSNEVYYATVAENEIVGVIAWEAVPQLGALVVTLAYVEPSSRRRGIYKELFTALCDHAKKRGARKIIHQIGVENATARTVMLATKALLTSQTFEHDIE
jgi:L-amino acid N-acyltransferase YncA